MPLSAVHERGIDPHSLLAIRDLEVRARVVVEGLWAGLHRSPYSGFSVEFTSYRQYSAGDDLRYLDWRVLARTDREYIKEFEDETNLRCQLFVDSSLSMGFGSLGFTKADYTRTLAATLAYFLLQQRDSVGLALFDEGLTGFLPARWRRGQLRRILALLERPTQGKTSDFTRAFHQVAPLWRRRCLVIILADLLSPVADWEGALGHLVANGHDVRVLQVLDPAEKTLEFGQTGLWEDVESGLRLYVDPRQARPRYLERFGAHQVELKQALERRGVVYQQVSTDQPFDFVLLEFLQKQGLGGLARRRRTRR